MVALPTRLIFAFALALLATCVLASPVQQRGFIESVSDPISLAFTSRN